MHRYPAHEGLRLTSIWRRSVAHRRRESAGGKRAGFCSSRLEFSKLPLMRFTAGTDWYGDPGCVCWHDEKMALLHVKRGQSASARHGGHRGLRPGRLCLSFFFFVIEAKKDSIHRLKRLIASVQAVRTFRFQRKPTLSAVLQTLLAVSNAVFTTTVAGMTSSAASLLFQHIHDGYPSHATVAALHIKQKIDCVLGWPYQVTQRSLMNSSPPPVSRWPLFSSDPAALPITFR